jgi:hypothetical protein
MPRWLTVFLLILALFLLVSIPLARQFDTASIEGLIADDHGNPVAGASIEARNTMSGVVMRTRADAGGHYELAGLRAGRYSLWVQAPGYESMWISEIIVKRGKATRKDVRLTPSNSAPPGAHR